MDFTTILSVSGKPGLYKVVSQSKNGLIVESLSDNKRMPVYSTHKVSSLSDISIYTYDEDKPLKDILKNIFRYTEGKETISPNSSADELTAYMRKLIPDYDENRVYNSDIKKLFKWYNLLLAAGFFDNIEEDEKEEAAKLEEEKAEEKKTASKPKIAGEKKTPKKAKTETKEPAKKSSTKKAAPTAADVKKTTKKKS